MKFLLAPNAMKGALSAQKIAAILSKTIKRKYSDAEIVSSPIADGGNGTLDCLMNALGGKIHEAEITGPTPTMRVTGRFGITMRNVAIIESAEAIGLHLLSPSPESIAQSTSRGVGELMRAALDHSCTEIWIGLGGSATNDGGAGMSREFGWEYIDDSGEELKDGAINLLKLKKINRYERGIPTVPIKILADVRSTLLGENGATYTFAKQKGASDEQLPYLESALKNFSDTVRRDMHQDYSDSPGSGAAGGLAFGLLNLGHIEIVSGIDQILETIKFDDLIRSCDCIVTTEGTLDEQTLSGKGVAGISQRANKYGKPLHAFVGRVSGDSEELKSALGLATLTQISPDEISSDQAMRDASWLLADTVYHHVF